MASTLTHYPVYLTTYWSPRDDHHAIYVDTNTESGGYLFHVEGSLQTGMAFVAKKACHPFISATGEPVRHIGWVSHHKFVDIGRVCETVPPPCKQYELSKRLVPRHAIRHCQHWAGEAIDALRKQAILEPLGPGDDAEVIMRDDVKVEKRGRCPRKPLPLAVEWQKKKTFPKFKD
ncbi:hypothetical protein BR93DRAFT_967375 [Coniochaeta sp. PMI_546]|nr:hypothetical protein BR93DRAFT_967375 [Coniochaeta sp. PMI_546]